MARLSSLSDKTVQCNFYIVYCLIGSLALASRNLPSEDDYKLEGTGAYKQKVLAAQFVIPQNVARAKVGDPSLLWDEKVASYAQWWADQRRGDCNLTHSDGPYGENIFWGSGDEWKPREAVAAWIEEKKWYNHKINSCRGYEECGHYTQIVWRQSRRVGCARVVCDNNDVFMICNYDPPGNYIGEKPY